MDQFRCALARFTHRKTVYLLVVELLEAQYITKVHLFRRQSNVGYVLQVADHSARADKWTKYEII